MSDSTGVKDVVSWLQGPAYGILNEWFQHYFPGTQWDSEGNFSLGTPAGFSAPGIPLEHMSEQEIKAIKTAEGVVDQGNPFSAAAHNITGAMQENIGSANQALQHGITGPLAQNSYNMMKDDLYGPGSNWGASGSVLGHQLSNQGPSGLADANLQDSLGSGWAQNRAAIGETAYGPRADAFRDMSQGAAQGYFLNQDPTASGGMLRGNPMLDDMYKRASSSMVDQYRDATAPSTNAMFANAGSFGGSAHQNLQAQQRYGLGRNLEELATGMYGGAYDRERGLMEQARDRERRLMDQATARERQFTEAMIGADMGQLGGMNQNQLNRAMETALFERNRLGSLQSQQLAQAYGLSTDQMNRMANILPNMPGLRSGDFVDSNVLSNIGDRFNEHINRNILTDYQNKMNEWEWNENLLRQLSQGLAPLLNITGYSFGEGAGGQQADPEFDFGGSSVGKSGPPPTSGLNPRDPLPAFRGK